MIEIICPSVIPEDKKDWLKIFVAGSISGCADWQTPFIREISKLSVDELLVLNPRRVDFDIGNQSMSEEQIEWEYSHLRAADVVVFWFAPETLGPIALYELGAMSSSAKRVIVGCDKDYKRSFDVKKQLSLIRSDVIVHDSIDSVLEEIAVAVREKRPVTSDDVIRSHLVDHLAKYIVDKCINARDKYAEAGFVSSISIAIENWRREIARLKNGIRS